MASYIDDLRLIAEIANHASLQGAAQQLKLNHATVFRRLAAFEAAVGVRLFERASGVYVATPAGDILVQAGNAIAEQAQLALRQVAGQDARPRGEVRIVTTDSLAYDLVWPSMVACRQHYPDIQLQLISGNRLDNLSKRDADIALRATVRPPEELIGKQLGLIEFAVYGASTYLQGRTDWPWERHTWLAPDDSMGLHRSLVWLQQQVPPLNWALRSNSFVNLRQACLQGAGLAVLPCFLATADLQRLSPTLPTCATPLWLLMHPDLRQTARVKVVFEQMQSKLSQQLLAWPCCTSVQQPVG